MTSPARHTLLAHQAGRTATWFELFVDLVFVVAVAWVAGRFAPVQGAAPMAGHLPMAGRPGLRRLCTICAANHALQGLLWAASLWVAVPLRTGLRAPVPDVVAAAAPDAPRLPQRQKPRSLTSPWSPVITAIT